CPCARVVPRWRDLRAERDRLVLRSTYRGHSYAASSSWAREIPPGARRRHPGKSYCGRVEVAPAACVAAAWERGSGSGISASAYATHVTAAAVCASSAGRTLSSVSAALWW